MRSMGYMLMQCGCKVRIDFREMMPEAMRGFCRVSFSVWQHTKHGPDALLAVHAQRTHISDIQRDDVAHMVLAGLPSA